ncbi:MAG: enoyl-CoA hydratase/isomerase family protein, partial [Bdellovibrionales bacterium]|nr:enoyl-CoA hydratase/isomerase family protein [Bdellovibrionales bacterium]
MTTHMVEATHTPGKATVEYTNHRVAIIRLGAPGESVVTLDRTRIDSLKAIVEELKTRPPKGVVIIGPNEDMFTAGADIRAIKEISDPTVGEKIAREGQHIFDDIEALPCITVSAVSGACVGGGCEMALACDYRIISDSPRSVIGLPETKLGIVPGFGGSQRLPRLIGLPAALDIILSGKTLRPKKALKVGLVDKVVKFEQLEQTAREIASGSLKIKRSRPGFVARLLTNTGFGRTIVKSKTEKVLMKKTKGFYPAPPAALEATLYGLERGIKEGLKNEAKALGRMIVTPECKALVNLFFLTEEVKGLGKAARKEVASTYGLVIGAGTMGAGIAGLLSQNKCNVILKDRTDADLEKGVGHIKRDLSKVKHLSEA